MDDVLNQMEEMMDLLKSAQTIKIKDEQHLKGLQESVDFESANSDEYEKDEREKKCLLESNLMYLTNKIVSLEQKFDKKGQYSRRNWVLVHGVLENKTEKADNIVISTISENLNIVISEEDIDKSQSGEKIDQDKTKPKSVIEKFVRINVCHKVFTNKRKLKGKGISIFERFTKLSSVNLNEARKQHTLGNV